MHQDTSHSTQTTKRLANVYEEQIAPFITVSETFFKLCSFSTFKQSQEATTEEKTHI